MSELDDIVFRLRKARVVEPSMPSEGYPTRLGELAADRIEELEELVERLKNEKR